MTAILVAEMRGFEAISTQLARELETIGITPERVRSAGISVANAKLDEISKKIAPQKRMHLGGDTWYFNFATLDEAIAFGASFLTLIKQSMVAEAMFLLKPSLAVSLGTPQFDGDRFLDDVSIQVYRHADSGKSFQFLAIGTAIGELKKQTLWAFEEIAPKENEVALRIHWEKISQEKLALESNRIAIPTLLLDSEVIYSESSSQAISYLIQQQERSKSVLAFGGPVSLIDPTYKNYVRSFVAQLRQGQARFTLLSYLPLNEPRQSYAWLELCKRLSVTYPEKLAFAAFAIPEGQLRPFSYHVYDKSTVHIGLRSFSPQRGTPTMSGAILFRNQQIATRFTDEFLENFRKLGAVTDSSAARIIGDLSGLNKDTKRLAMEDVDSVLAE